MGRTIDFSDGGSGRGADEIILAKALDLAYLQYLQVVTDIGDLEKTTPDENKKQTKYQCQCAKLGTIYKAAAANVIFDSHALSEGLINIILAEKLDKETFDDLEGMKIILKWTQVPKLFCKDYVFDKSDHLYACLKETVAFRNNLTHLKVKMWSNWAKDELKHKGKTPEYEKLTNKFVSDCYALPLRLLEYYSSFDKDKRVWCHMLEDYFTHLKTDA